jgi:hypothetical protein
VAGAVLKRMLSRIVIVLLVVLMLLGFQVAPPGFGGLFGHDTLELMAGQL